MKNEGNLKISGVDIYQRGNTILKDINLEIEKGDFVYLVGRVGSGKSSLLKTLYAEIPLKKGKINVNGFNLRNIPTGRIPILRRSFGIVFQDFKLLFDRNIYANLDFVLKATGWKNAKKREARIYECLEYTDMKHKASSMPYQLSGGEQQRVVISRALLNEPPIILADEPTGNLDPENSFKIISLLRDINNNGTTIIMATHHYSLLTKFPGKVIRFQDKNIEDVSINLSMQTEEEEEEYEEDIEI